MMRNAAQPIDHSLETLLNSGNYRDRIRFITVPRTNDTERRTDFEKKENGKYRHPKRALIAVPPPISLPAN